MNLPIHKAKLRIQLRWCFIHTAFIIFGCDLVATFWPAFEVIWSQRVAHVGIVIASFVAVAAEYFTGAEK